eukprot:TRINITY_DN4132_c0_g1_i1.p1 TRINITY_DN4132_c0_g1~~TRINITY_DN4132_c0_g1_i1.p1  ORF type:complete len:917 (-),score=292.39 TRINITY_DN4132_c0_g1_i1:102-2852(-)
MTNPAPGGPNGPPTPHPNGSPIGDWRKGSADIKLLLKNLYTQSPMLHTDVTFKFNNGDRIHAHKLILTLFSPVFEAEFYGSLNQDGEIPITDIEPEIFKMLLGYLYTSIPLDVKDKDFDCSKAWNLWYATEKYILPELSESCKLKIQQCVQNHDHYTLLNLVNAVKYHISDYITFHATEKVNKALETIIHTEEWKSLEEYVFVHILSQENLSLTEGQLFEAILNWCRAKCQAEGEEDQREAIRQKLSRFLDYIKWENMSGEEFVDLVSASDALSLEQYKTFSIRIFKANCKGKRSMTREMANPLRVYRKAIPCPKAVYNMRGGDYDDLSTSPSPRPFHTFKFPHITVEVETTPQFVALKNDDPQNQLCIKFKTILSPGGKTGRTQVFASVILENQLERVKSVFKRMKIADTNSLGPSEPQMRYQTPKKSKYAMHQQQMEYAGAFFQGGSSSGNPVSTSRRTTPPIRQDMFVIPIHKLEDRKFGFLLRNKTISLNICIDVREVFNIKVVKESSWASFDGNVQSEVVTVQKTSVLADVQAAVEKQFGLEGGNFRLWWRSYNENDNGVFRVVPNDTESIWEKTDNFVPAIPTAFEQEPELTLFIEECDSEKWEIKEEFPRILVFLKIYDPETKGLEDAGKIYPLCYSDTESPTFQSGLGFKNMVLQKAVLQDCKAVYLINRRADSVEKLIFDTDKNGAQPDREVAGEDGDICIVELNSTLEEGLVGFEDFYETLRNTRDILIKSKSDSMDFPSEFHLTLTLSTNYNALKHQIKQFLLANGRIGPNGERLSCESVELYQCYWSSVSGLSPRSAEFPVDHHFDGNLDDLLKSGSADEPRIYFKAITRMVAPSLEPVEPQPRRENEPSVQEGEGSGILVGGIVAEGAKGILVRGLEDDGEDQEEEQEEPERKKQRFLNINQD